jgi:hypothetical protein
MGENMGKHFREFPGASYDAWKTTNPADDWLGPDPHEEDEPELKTLDDDPQPGDLCECGSCGKAFRFDHDNYFARYTAIICDPCVERGWPWRD